MATDARVSPQDQLALALDTSLADQPEAVLRDAYARVPISRHLPFELAMRAGFLVGAGLGMRDHNAAGARPTGMKKEPVQALD